MRSELIFVFAVEGGYLTLSDFRKGLKGKGQNKVKGKLITNACGQKQLLS